MSDIIVEFSGWVRITPENAKFVNINAIDEKGKTLAGVMTPIDGLQWLALSEEERGNYILKSVIDAQQDADVGEYDRIDVFEDDSVQISSIHDLKFKN
jgi:hypothetical protein